MPEVCYGLEEGWEARREGSLNSYSQRALIIEERYGFMLLRGWLWLCWIEPLNSEFSGWVLLLQHSESIHYIGYMSLPLHRIKDPRQIDYESRSGILFESPRTQTGASQPRLLIDASGGAQERFRTSAGMYIVFSSLWTGLLSHDWHDRIWLGGVAAGLRYFSAHNRGNGEDGPFEGPSFLADSGRSVLG